MTWFRHYLCPVARKTSGQVWTFSFRYLFAYPKASQDDKTVARVLINIMTQHAKLPTTIISDKGSTLVTQVIKEVPDVLASNREHATAKYAQTIGMLDRTHNSLKRELKSKQVYEDQ